MLGHRLLHESSMVERACTTPQSSLSGRSNPQVDTNSALVRALSLRTPIERPNLACAFGLPGTPGELCVISR